MPRKVEKTPGENLQKLNERLQIKSSKITVVYRKNKVSACCKVDGRIYGGSGLNHSSAIKAMNKKYCSSQA